MIGLRLRLQEAWGASIRSREEFAARLANFLPHLLDGAFELVRTHEELAARLYQARANLPPADPLRQRIEEAAAEAAVDLLAIQRVKDPDQGGYPAFIRRYRTIWRENASLFLFTATLFLISAISAWSMTVRDPSAATAILSQNMIEDVLEQKKWFEDIQPSPVFEGIRIAVNNIQVAINCFVLGALLGLGGLAILSYNGILLGAVLGFCSVNGFDDELIRFVTGHGVLEMTIIVASAFASFLFGRVFYMRPWSLFRTRLALAASDAGIVVLGILPWLLLAACIEVFVSPWPQYSLESRVGVGLGVAALFWAWTLWPGAKDLTKKSR